MRDAAIQISLEMEHTVMGGVVSLYLGYKPFVSVNNLLRRQDA